MFMIFPVIAIVTTTAIHVFWLQYRKSLYKEFDHSASRASERGQRSTSDDARNLIKNMNSVAVSAQNQFQSQLSVSVSMLFSAFFLFSISLSWKITEQSFLASLYSTELILMICAMYFMKQSIKKKHLWLKSRAITELVRRQYFIRIVAGLEEQPLSGTDFNEIKNHYKKRICGVQPSELDEFCRQDFEMLQSKYSGLVENRECAAKFQEQRIQHQKDWFSKALKRLEKQINDREKVIRSSFFLVGTLALTKALFYLGFPLPYFEILKSYLNLITLSAMGFTVLTAAIIINTGALPLAARYSSQLASIDRILNIPQDDKQNKAVNFEKLMQDELSFFLQGLGHHGIEISL